ncbi:hypothetical protein COT50_00395 [candidate division WWE3 bacterium CG08_land_8_20_14_0_20_41_10]|uniref:Homing endonuclease LAGLIDADG domain-containing protein n=1 Tax=candidate division WWE3 bacterium CG08_land_8_20_14_0_20_41_10 TaxID=1975085 RepID=A0A2H0XF36_UNCKA|nr:MAG: hypothetical protein COT50_00395 [candidate division WWE3 bacterium CG08_land_8_20_14_0_20_41_10]
MMGNTVGSQRNLTKRQKGILIGTLFGDGCLEKNGKNVRLRIEHGLKQKNYLLWKYNELRNLVAGKPRLVVGAVDNRTGKSYKRWHFSTFSLPKLNAYWYKFYRHKQKKIPKDILELLKLPLSLAVWFMDDGYKRNDCNALRINTDSFNNDEQKIVQKCLMRNFGIKSKLHRKGEYWNIYIPNSEAKKFCKIIKPFIIAELKYKISLTP